MSNFYPSGPVELIKGRPVLVLGDIMLDRYIRGPADRISPEAPVPVVHVAEDTFTPGGAGNEFASVHVILPGSAAYA